MKKSLDLFGDEVIELPKKPQEKKVAEQKKKNEDYVCFERKFSVHKESQTVTWIWNKQTP